jgi:hypothetical protein
VKNCGNEQSAVGRLRGGIRTAQPKIFSRKFCEPVPRQIFCDGKKFSRGRIPPFPQEKFDAAKEKATMWFFLFGLNIQHFLLHIL